MSEGAMPDDRNIRALVLDIDGVLTDGRVSINPADQESKSLSYRDIDAVFQARREGLQLALLTGEDSPMVSIVASRLQVEDVIAGAKDKQSALREISRRLDIPLSQLCYVGDSDRDAPALREAGLGLAPADGSAAARNAATRTLENGGGHGAVAEALDIIRGFNSTESGDEITENAEKSYSSDSASEGQFNRRLGQILEESISVKQGVHANLRNEMSTAADWLVEAFGSGKKLLLFGNGGSAADAQHMAGEFVGRFYKERQAWPAIALTTDTSILTALGNDYDFDRIFARQVEAIVGEGDVVIGFSTSGNSKNVVQGMNQAKSQGARTIAFTGEGGGEMSNISDLLIAVPSNVTPRIQESHITIIHAICEVVETTLVDMNG